MYILATYVELNNFTVPFKAPFYETSEKAVSLQ